MKAELFNVKNQVLISNLREYHRSCDLDFEVDSRQKTSKPKFDFNLVPCLHVKFQSKMKMIPLKTNRFVLTWLCVYPAEIDTSIWKQRAQKSFCIFNFVFLILLICTSLMHLSKSHIERNSEEIVFMVLQITGILNSIYLMAAIFILRDKITQMLDSLTEIYKICKH